MGGILIKPGASEKLLVRPGASEKLLVQPPFPRNGLVLYLPLGHSDLSGDVFTSKDDYKNICTVHGATWTPSGRDFNPLNPDYIEIPAAHTQLNFTSEDFSIIMRVYFDALATNTFPFIRGLYHTDGYYILVRTTGNLEGWTSQTPVSQRTYSALAVITTGAWFTIGFSRTGASIIVYANGVAPDQTAGVHIDPDTCERTAKMGIDDDLTNYPFDGKIEFLLGYKRALSESEHLDIHNHFSTK